MDVFSAIHYPANKGNRYATAGLLPMDKGLFTNDLHKGIGRRRARVDAFHLQMYPQAALPVSAGAHDPGKQHPGRALGSALTAAAVFRMSVLHFVISLPAGFTYQPMRLSRKGDIMLWLWV